MRIWLFATVLTLFARIAIADEELKCKYKAGNGGTTGEAHVILTGNIINVVTFYNYTVGLPGNLGYSCEIEARRSDKETKWIAKNSSIVIEFTESKDENGSDFMIIKPIRNGYALNMEKITHSYFCGAGSDLPKTVAIERDNNICRVEFKP